MPPIENIIKSSDSRLFNKANFQVTEVTFDPPSGTTLMAGEYVTATIRYNSALKGNPVQIWATFGESELSSAYEPSELEPASGQLTRYMQITDEGHIDEIYIVAQHKSGERLFVSKHKVDYSFVHNPEREQLRHDGQGSSVKITKVLVNDNEIKPNAKLSKNAIVDVEVEYNNTSEHGASLSLQPTYEETIQGGYDSSSELKYGKGKISKFFQIKSEGHTTGIHVVMLNASDEVIAEQILNFPINFVNPRKLLSFKEWAILVIVIIAMTIKFVILD